MPRIQFEGHSYVYHEGETVLAALIRGGAQVTHSCRRGTCQSCLLKLDGAATNVELVSPRLPGTQLEAGTFLACQTQAAPLSVRRVAHNELWMQARVLDKVQVNAELLHVRLEPPGPFMWHPGQLVNLRDPVGNCRSCIASSVVFLDYWLGLLLPCGADEHVGTWLRDDVAVGDYVELQGPFGDCRYQSSMAHTQLVFVADGPGVGPCLGIAREAQLRGHPQPMWLYTDSTAGFEGELDATRAELFNQLPQLTVTRCDATCTSEARPHGSVADVAFARREPLANTTIFLCGSAQMVERGTRHAIALGVRPDALRTAVFATAQ